MKQTTSIVIGGALIGLGTIISVGIATGGSTSAATQTPAAHVATVKKLPSPPATKGYALFWPSTSACAPLMRMTVDQLMTASPEQRNHEALCEDWDIASRVSGD